MDGSIQEMIKTTPHVHRRFNLLTGEWVLVSTRHDLIMPQLVTSEIKTVIDTWREQCEALG